MSRYTSRLILSFCILLCSQLQLACQEQAAKEVREFWPEYALPGQAFLLPGNRRVEIARPTRRFQIPHAVPVLDGERASDHVADVFQNSIPVDNFSIEFLLLHHVNQPVAAAFYAYEDSPLHPNLLLSYSSQKDGDPVDVVLDVLSDPGNQYQLNLSVDGSRAYKKYWYHVVCVAQPGEWKIAVNGAINGLGIRVPQGKAGEGKRKLDIATYTNNEPAMQLANVVKWVKFHDQPLSEAQIATAYEAAKKQIDQGIKYPERLHFNAGPYLNFATRNSINVLWETNKPCRAEIHYGLTSNLGEIVRVDELSDKSVEDNQVFIQETSIRDLQPDTQYFYNVKLESFDGEPLESGVLTFKTAVREDQDFMFAAFGDTETRPHINDRVAKRVWGERPNFVINLGDLTDGGKQDHKWQWNFEYFDGMSQLHSRIPVFPVAGNGEGDLYWYSRYHVLPGQEAYYRFNYGNAEFFMMNSNRRADQFQPGGEQYQWLDENLARSQAHWKFVAMHHAPYSTEENDYGDTWKNSRGDQGDVKVRALVPLFEKHGVDIVFFGHLHTYSRMGPIRNDVINRQDGVVYIQTGGAGGNLEDFAPTKTWFSQKLFAGHHYCLINISGNRLFFKMYDLDGHLGDYMQMDKPDVRTATADEPPQR